ncbi:MAG: inosose isomerase [Litorilinea sp.]|nr:MAG: inosose isomerase [Litorilinea sp.]
MQLAFHGATTMTSNLETDVRVSAQAGYRALELWAAKIDVFLEQHASSDLRRLLEAHGVTPTAINSIEFIAFRGDEFEQIKARCHRLCAIAQAIGCPAVAVIPSPAPAWNSPWEMIVEEHVCALRELSDVAAEYGVKLAFEFIGYGGFSVRTPRGAWEIIRRAERDNIGMVIDVAHFFAGGGLLEELDSIDPDRIYAFHLDDVPDIPKEAYSDALRLLPGLGVAPVDELCARLAAIGYDGPCSIELFRPEYWEWDPLELAVRAREAALRVLSPHFVVV